MTILSPIMSFVVDKEIGFPIPSEKEKLNKALKRYRNILALHPERTDAPEIMFGIADLLIGRGEAGDWAEAMKILDRILLRNPSEYLKARALVEKAELLIGNFAEADNAISLCEKARKILGSDLSEFFTAKTYMVEAELRFSRHGAKDWERALDLINHVLKEKRAHWYFRGRAFLSKAEITLYQKPRDLKTPVKLCDASIKELKSRQDDYFSQKARVLKAEILMRRGKKVDLDRAAKLFTEVIKMPLTYKDLVARAKLNLAEITNNPRASKLLKEVSEMEGLDPYLTEKAHLAAATLLDKKRDRKHKR
ncbi:MAG: tetratricopeptide repeat protein [Candidatus Margulisiibacteriota bacterium]